MKCGYRRAGAVLSSRSPCGERGLKLLGRGSQDPVPRRSPCGERGLKWAGSAPPPFVHGSLPVRGAWIEIGLDQLRRLRRARRSPCGERGLKSRHAEVHVLCAGRSPCGERGLKCIATWLQLVATTSLPVRGAWIEIVCSCRALYPRHGRSPCGERGLKYFLTFPA